MGQINSCGAFVSSGLSRCNGRYQPPIGIVISEVGVEYTSAELATLAKRKTNMSLNTGIKSLYFPISGLNDTTDEPNTETTNTGIKNIWNYGIPSIEVFMDRAFDDYRTLWAMNNTLVEVEIITADRFAFVTPVSNGKYKGFRAQMFMQPGMPKFETGNEAHKISINFKDISEWQNLDALPLNYSASEIEGLMPVGVNLRADAAYDGSSGGIVLQATLRGGAVGYAGLDTWTVKGVSKGLANVVVTAVAGTDGSYTVTALKNTTDKLVDGDYVIVQGAKVVSTYATYLTNYIQIDGVTP